MGEHFNKFKKKLILEAIIKSILIGCSSAIALTGAVIIIAWLYKVDVQKDLYLYIIAGVLLMILFTAALFLIFKPSNIKAAKRMDRQLDLDEKVQTMVEFEKEEGLIIEVQREDTNEVLSNIPLKKFKMKLHFILFIIPIFAIALGVTSVVVTANAKEEPKEEVPDNPFDFDIWYTARFLALIEDVRNSDIKDEVKNDFITELNELYDQLVETEVESLMKTYVNSKIAYIHHVKDIHNSNDEIAEALKESTDTTVNSLGRYIGDLDIDNTKIALTAIRGLSVGAEDLTAGLEEVHAYFGTVLREYAEDQDSELYNALYDLSDQMRDCTSADEVKTLFDDSIRKIEAILLEQKKNSDMADYIENELKDIFGLNPPVENETPTTTPTGPDSTGTSTGTNTTKPNEDQDFPGGAGDGEMEYGSDDTIYDPNQDIITEYGPVMSALYAEIMAMINNSDLSDEQKAILYEYYSILFGSANSNNETNDN